MGLGKDLVDAVARRRRSHGRRGVGWCAVPEVFYYVLLRRRVLTVRGMRYGVAESFSRRTSAKFFFFF